MLRFRFFQLLAVIALFLALSACKESGSVELSATDGDTELAAETEVTLDGDLPEQEAIENDTPETDSPGEIEQADSDYDHCEGTETCDFPYCTIGSYPWYPQDGYSMGSYWEGLEGLTCVNGDIYEIHYVYECGCINTVCQAYQKEDCLLDDKGEECRVLDGTPTCAAVDTTGALPAIAANWAARPISARLYENGKLTLPTYLEALTQTIVTFKPSWVSGFWKVGKDEALDGSKALRDYLIVRTFANRVAPTEFDLYLDALDYDTPEALISRLDTLYAATKTRLYVLDNAGQAQQSKPELIAAAIAWAHTLGLKMGGVVWQAPTHSDFDVLITTPAAAAANGGPDPLFSPRAEQSDLEAARLAAIQAKTQGPLFLALDNQSQSAAASACIFNLDFTFAKRKQYVGVLAAEQSAKGYTLLYPIYYPLCPAQSANDSQQGGLYKTMLDLAKTYNPLQFQPGDGWGG